MTERLFLYSGLHTAPRFEVYIDASQHSAPVTARHFPVSKQLTCNGGWFHHSARSEKARDVAGRGDGGVEVPRLRLGGGRFVRGGADGGGDGAATTVRAGARLVQAGVEAEDVEVVDSRRRGAFCQQERRGVVVVVVVMVVLIRQRV